MSDDSQDFTEKTRLARILDLFGSIELVTIDQPDEGGNLDVRRATGACFGTGTIKGTAIKSGATLISVKVTYNGTSVTLQTTTGGKWSTDIPSLKCQDGATCLDGKNKVKAAAEWLYNGTTLTESTPRNFTGTCVSAFALSSSATQVPMQVPQVQPATEHDGWLQYRDLLTSSPFETGKVLMRGNAPLAATVVQVYATNILWYHHSLAVEAIHRPLGLTKNVIPGVTFPIGDGDLIIGREPFRFVTAPKCAICLLQLPFESLSNDLASHEDELVHVVASSSPTAPEILPMRPDQPIIVRVNDSRFPNLPHSGSFDLWVKVIG